MKRKCEALYHGKKYFPLYGASVPAGFPSPADDFIEDTLDLNDYLIRHPAATFFVRARGDSMVGAGIHSGDILVVDRALEPWDKAVVIVALDGELAVKRIRYRGGRILLQSENPDYPSIEIPAGSALHVWGVVIHVIHSFA